MSKAIKTLAWAGAIALIIYIAVEVSTIKVEAETSQNPPVIPISSDPADSVCVNIGGDSSTFVRAKTFLSQTSDEYIQSLQSANIPVVSHIPPTIPPATETKQIASIQQAEILVSDIKQSTPNEIAGLVHSDDFRTVKCQGKEYFLSTTQALVVQRIIEGMNKGITAIYQDALLEDSGVYSKRIRDVFKSSPAWKALVIPLGKGFFRLNTSPA
jgi:hypothetical protein